MKCQIEGCERKAWKIYLGHEGYVTKQVGKRLCQHHYNLQIFRELAEANMEQIRIMRKLQPFVNQLCEREEGVNTTK